MRVDGAKDTAPAESPDVRLIEATAPDVLEGVLLIPRTLNCMISLSYSSSINVCLGLDSPGCVFDFFRLRTNYLIPLLASI